MVGPCERAGGMVLSYEKHWAGRDEANQNYYISILKLSERAMGGRGVNGRGADQHSSQDTYVSEGALYVLYE